VIYNVITPNGDGINDTWIIDCIENFPDNEVQLFNIWGDLINTFSRYDNTRQVWRGTNLRDMHVPDGTYYYILAIKDMKPRVGWVLVRGGW
jgi:gliding motility-associated-like protein